MHITTDQNNRRKYNEAYLSGSRGDITYFIDVVRLNDASGNGGIELPDDEL